MTIKAVVFVEQRGIFKPALEACTLIEELDVTPDHRIKTLADLPGLPK